MIVQTTTEPGLFTLHATAPGLRSASLEFQSLVAPSLSIVPVAEPRYFLEGWRMSPIVPDRPDPHQTIAEQDMNTWEAINPASGPQKQWQQARGYAIYRSAVRLPKSMRSAGGRIVFGEIIGSARIYVGRDETAIKTDPSPGRFEIQVPPSSEKMAVSVLIQSDAFPAGITQAVELCAFS